MNDRRMGPRAILMSIGVSVALATRCATDAGIAATKPELTQRVVAARSGPEGRSVGIVLTGGGAFGAWEVGALQAFFDAWRERYGAEPPIRVIAGASTGALIAPFLVFGQAGVSEVTDWYTRVRQSDIVAPKLGAILPLPLFAATTSSVYGVGFTGDVATGSSRLWGKLATALIPKLERIGAAWSAVPPLRLAIAALDFKRGAPRVFTNSPSDLRQLPYGILASAMAPLALPPIPISEVDGAAFSKNPHLDGSIYAVAPIGELFDVAALPPQIGLTDLVIISAFPRFPGDDDKSVQPKPFPRNPSFTDVGDRMTVLLSEASASKEIALLRAALALRAGGTSPAAVAGITGLRIPSEPPALCVLAPEHRLGSHVLRFQPKEMTTMYELGLGEGRGQLAPAGRCALN